MLSPTQLLESLTERCDLGLHFWIIFSPGIQHADAPHALALLRARSEGPRGRATEQRDEVAPLHVEHGDFSPYALSAPPKGWCARTFAPPVCHSEGRQVLGAD